jgi:hypothetical protein
VPNNTYARLLARAAELLGGPEQLRSYLAVSETQFAFWMQGRSKLPDNVFLRIADLISERDNTRST